MGQVFYVGEVDEVQHHVEPLLPHVPIDIVTPDEVVRCAKPGDLTIYFSEHFDRFRHAILRLRENNVATLYAIDGILEWRNSWENADDEPACPWTMRPVLSHKVACIGPSQARVLSHWNHPAQIEVVGIPRLDRLIALHNKQTIVGGVTKSKSLTDARSVLVTTAKCPWYTDEQRAQVFRSIHALRSWEKQHEGKFEIVWRLTRGLAAEVGVENSLVSTSGVELVKLLNHVDIVITTPSTVQLEAMLAGKPTAILDFTNSPSLVDAAWKITHESQIDGVLNEMRTPPAHRMQYQEMLLQDALIVDGRATDRMVSLINQMLRIAKQQVSEGVQLNLSTGFIELERPVPRFKFDLATVFPEEPAFRMTEHVTLQAELGHARREIEHLQRQIESLRKELAEAHKIFEQIHQHPIAGPIVRTRQRLLDWLEKAKSRTKPVNSSESSQS